MRRQLGAPVRELDVVLAQRERLARLGHAMHESDNLGNLAAERTRIHHQSAADRAGNAFAEFEPLKTAIDYFLHQRPERGGRASDYSRVVDSYFCETVTEPHD